VCIDVLYGDVLSRRRFVEETFCMCAELPAHRRGILRKSRFSAGNYQLRDKKSSRGMGFRRE
jgi:hypothetical protein